ncbi:hypothetical protein VN1219_13310 [Helicobacter pylori]|nr:hypothetical protein VN1219_13310 [Helicobacter pylori]
MLGLGSLEFKGRISLFVISGDIYKLFNRNKSEFIFKTMFKEKGDYKNAPDYEKNIKEND